VHDFSVTGLSADTSYTGYCSHKWKANRKQYLKATNAFTTLAGGGGGGNDLTGTVMTLCSSGCDFDTPAEAAAGINTLGVDLCIMDGEDYSADTLTLSHQWDGEAGDPVKISTCYNDAGDSNILRWYADGTGTGRGAKAKINFVDYRAADDPTLIDIDDVFMPEKWNPGHYVYTVGLGSRTKAGKGMVIFDEDHQRRRQNHWAYYDEDAFAGVTFVTHWGQLEPTDGGYGPAIEEIREDLDFLETLDTDKHMIFWFHDQKYGGANVYCPTTEDGFQGEVEPVYDFVHPGWMWDKYPTDTICDRTNNSSHGLAMWNSNVRTELLEFWQAMGKALDSHPRLEAVIVNLESAVGGAGGGRAPGFTVAGHREGLKALALGVKSYFPRTSVILNLNWAIGDQDDHDDIVAWAQANDIGLGNTDLPPLCVNQPWGSGPQDPDCPDGLEDLTADAHPIRTFNSIKQDDPTGIIPMIYRVGGDQLGQGHWVGQQGGYSPEIFVQWCNDDVKCTHLFWIETFDYAQGPWGEPDQVWKTGVLPFIRTDPAATLTNDACPSSACK